MKPIEVWEGDLWLYVSSWGTLTETLNEVKRLNAVYNMGYFVRKVNEAGQYLDKSKWS